MGFMKARAERQMMDQVFNLKFTSKQLNKASKKAEKDEKVALRLSAGLAQGCNKPATCMLDEHRCSMR